MYAIRFFPCVFLSPKFSSNDILLFNLDRDTHPKKVVIIEWADKLENNRNCDLRIAFKHINKAREISITTSGNLFKQLAKDYE